MTSVMFATPSLNYSVSLEYLRSTTETQWALADRGIQSGYILRPGDQFIAKARNKIVSEFLRDYPAIENLFFLDDDIGWPAAKVIEFLDRPEPIIAGVYPKKSEAIDFPVELTVDPDTGLLFERDGLVRANMVPAGFLRIKRAVLERLVDGAEQFCDLDADGVTRWHPAVFESGVGPNKWWWGEDYAFSQKWLATGGELWVDPSITFTHRGTRKWEAAMADHLPVFRERAAALAAKAKVVDLGVNVGRAA